MPLEGVLDEAVEDLGTQPSSDERHVADEVVDSGGVARDRGYGEGPLPLRMVPEPVPLYQSDGLTVSFHHEDLGRLDAVDSWSVPGFHSSQVVLFTPPRLDMRGGEPLRQQGEVGPTKGSEAEAHVTQTRTAMDETGQPGARCFRRAASGQLCGVRRCSWRFEEGGRASASGGGGTAPGDR